MGYINDEMNEPTFLDRASIEQRFALWPKRCRVSKKLIWFENSYCATRVYTGPGDPVVEQRWYKCKDFLFWRIKWGI